MRRVTIAVIGNGKTTRANVDALIGDIIDSVDEAQVALIYDQKKSEGQTWAAQFAESRGLTPIEIPDNNFQEIVKHAKQEEVRFFLLWDDDDISCQDASSFAQGNNLPIFDLTDGLMAIKPTSQVPKIEKPVIPEVESKTKEEAPKPVVAPSHPAVPEPDEEDDEDDEEDDDDDFTIGDMITDAFEEVAKMMAVTFVEEVKRLLKDEPADD